MNRKRILILGAVWPEPRSTAAGSRMMQIIAWLRADGAEIHFASEAQSSEFSANLSDLGIRCTEVKINDSSFDTWLKELLPDIVVFDRFMTEEKFGWRVSETCPNALRILDLEDLHGLRIARQDALKKQSAFTDDLLLNPIAYRELASIYRCDISWVISPFEMEILQRVFQVDESLLSYYPFLIKDAHLTTTSAWKEYHQREHLISIGNFLHAPNADSVRFLKEHIWPLIHQKLPHAEMHVYGAYPNSEVLSWSNPKQGFFVKGRAEDAREVISNAKLLIAPLRFGAGMKGKLLEAMLYGTPSVTTEIGAEGMHGELDWPGAIATNPSEFAEHVIQLYSNENLWRLAQSRALPILTSCFSEAIFLPQIKHKVYAVLNALQEHRKRNIVGQLITSQTLTSTKYMSKWIEAKNKLGELKA